jgi:DNA polymerase elongation subunit (family B)
MLNYPLKNIANIGNKIYLFNRQKDGSLTIMQDTIFKPYFYEEDPKGIYQTIDGKKVSKITCREPGEIKRRKTDTSYEADVIYPKRYMIDKVSEILPSPTKYLFIDIEIQTKELPSYLNPDKTITSISIYNSLEKTIRNWFIKDYLEDLIFEKLDYKQDKLEMAEDDLLKNAIRYIKDTQPDLILGWNFVQFDYPYLVARIKRLWNLELAELISPISKMRYGRKEDEIPYPTGISILDYLDLFKKIYKGEVSYALDSIAHKYLNTPLNKKADFSQITEEIKEKNIEDIKKMVGIEKEKKIIPYYDEIRRMGKCLWEDIVWNSKVLDMMLLSEAKSKGIVLPSKHYGEDFIEEIEFEGAYRRAELGRFEGLYKLDLSSAYPMAIIDFCLDIANLTQNKNELKIDITDRETNEIKYPVYFKQNSNALLPTLARKLIIKKDYLKKQLKLLDPETPEAKDLQMKYDAVKALVNSLFGVTALKVFRLYNVNIASAITSIIRDLLHYVEIKLKENGAEVIYLDTDSVFIKSTDLGLDILSLCNNLVKQWAKEKYNKDNIGIEFDLEGIYEKILIVALCHYVGYLKKKDGKIKKEIKGVEAKRKDSSKFMQEFQTKLIDKILDRETQSQIIEFINTEKERIKIVPLIDIGFPCKINNITVYKSPPIFTRALEYSKELCGFTKVAGDTFYYIYVEPFGKAIRKATRSMKNKETGEKEEKSSEKEIDKNVMAFDEEIFDHIKRDAFDIQLNENQIDQKVTVNWKKMVDKTIIGKCENIFEALGWDLGLIKEIKVKKTKKQDNLTEKEINEELKRRGLI